MPMTYAFGGKTLTLRQWSAELGLTESALRQRLAFNWPPERVFTPNKKLKRYKNHINERYGTLIVVGFAGRAANGGYLWMCKCDCGRVITVPTKRLKTLKVCGRKHKPGTANNNYLHTQPCWSCKNYVDGCVWARTRTQPVEGWIAEPTAKRDGKRDDIRSYAILYCPEYKPDGTEARLDG